RVCTTPASGFLAGASADYAAVEDDSLNKSAFYVNTGTTTDPTPGYGVGIALMAITDGTSNTLLMGEKHLTDPDIGTSAVDGCISSARASGADFRQAGPKHPLALGSTDAQNRQFGSWHPGVVNLVFCDRHVTGLTTSVPGTTLGALATRAGGE